MANSAKDNFNQAMFGMFGIGRDPDASPASAAPSSPTPAPAPDPAPRADSRDVLTASPYSPSEQDPAAKRVVQPTYIAPGTILEGDLRTAGDVDIAGVLTGNLVAEGHVTIRADLTGNITSAELQVLSSTITGDTHVSGHLSISADSTIVGNVFAGDFLCSGRVKGDLNISGRLSLRETANVEGNIITSSMEMAAGALLYGTVQMKPAAAR